MVDTRRADLASLPAAFASLASAVAGITGASFHDGAIISQVTPGHYDDDGVYVPGSPATSRPCKVQIDTATEAMRQSDGYADGGVRFLILSASFTGTLDTDASLTIADGPFAGSWAVSSLQRDPAGIGWTRKGRRV